MSNLSERAKDFKRENDRLALRITESYGSLISLSKISTSEQLMSREAFQMDVAVQSLVTSGEGLLRLIHELKLAILLQDVQAMDAEVLYMLCIKNAFTTKLLSITLFSP
jgi:Surfeit locus protein 5 subunit 22 of Mediator complex